MTPEQKHRSKIAALKRVEKAVTKYEQAGAARDAEIREANKVAGVSLRELEAVTGLGKSRLHVIANTEAVTA